MNPLLQLRDAGQSVWLDNISRSLVKDGELERLVREDGVGGVTSNPTIFEKAIGHGGDYDAQLEDVLKATPGIDTQSLFETLALEDIRAAADILRPVYDRTGGSDGYVSFEVPASVANDTGGTVAEARRLWKAIHRPNVMIKVPATPPGIPAIEQLIGEGININITLMFSLDHYEQVAQAYLRGLRRCGQPSGVASVASFFVSRVDSVVDKQLEQAGTAAALALRGRAAVANSKIVYQRFRDLFEGEAFADLRARGCRVQRPLWASTSTKNPAYRDVVYVEELVGRDTVNTMPPATIDAFRDHGQVRPTAVEQGVEAARRDLEQLNELGVDLESVTRQLQLDGVASFGKSADDLAAALEKKRGQLAKRKPGPTPQGGAPAAISQERDPTPRFGGRTAAKLRSAAAGGGMALLLPAEFATRVSARLEEWERDRVCERIWAKEQSVWSPAPVPELTDRLGWLSMPGEMGQQAAALTAFAEDVRGEGIRHVVLLGMGGSSLAPEVFGATFGPRDGFPALIVLDSTHPAAVADVERRLDLARTLFLVSSKSGTTGETNAFFQYFWSRYEGDPARGAHFVAITDPGTSLERLARERGFRRVFSAPPDVGGRYSALTVFGLVPAALIGVDIQELLARAVVMAKTAACPSGADNPSLALGAALGELALAGRDKLTFLVPPALSALPAWLEQLIAESTGKHGKGIVPVADEPPLAVEQYGDDRVFVSVDLADEEARVASGFSPIGPTNSPGDVESGSRRIPGMTGLLDALQSAGHPIIRITLDSPLALGAEFFRWEFAVAAAGAVLGIQPFDQPDVQLAKELARKAMAAGGGTQAAAGAVATEASAWPRAVEDWLSRVRPGQYVGLQAYLAPRAATTEALQGLRAAIGRRTGLATTLGYGPRFLHSTGQLHKGGPDTGLFLQLTDEAPNDIPVPETSYTFGQLIAAQAAGDAMALEQRGRRVLRIALGRDALGGLRRLAGAI